MEGREDTELILARNIAATNYDVNEFVDKAVTEALKKKQKKEKRR